MPKKEFSLYLYFFITCLTLYFQDSLMLLHIAIVIYFHSSTVFHYMSKFQFTSPFLLLFIYLGVNIWVVLAVLFVVMCIRTYGRGISLGYKTRSQTAALQSTHKFSFTWQYQTVFKVAASVYTHSYPQCMNCLVAAYPY